MPGFDGSGPDGLGPTGGRRGPCSSETRKDDSKDELSLGEVFRKYANRTFGSPRKFSKGGRRFSGRGRNR